MSLARRKVALSRVEEALRDAKYHDGQAKAARAKATTIAKVWDISISKGKATLNE